MPDVVGTLVRQEEPEGRRHQCTHLIERAWAERAEEGLQFGEGLFDRIEVGAVGRKEPQQRADALNRRANLRLFVSGEIVEHHDIAGSQRRDEDLLDVRAEGSVVERSIEDRCSGQFGRAERRHHRVRLPVAAGCVIRNACPPRTPRVAAQ